MPTDVNGSRERRDRTVWWFLGAAALVSILFYREFIFHPGRLIYGSDMLFEGISLRRFYVDEIRAGRGVPLWVPHIYGGMPFVGLLPGPIFYPSTLLYFFMPLHRAIGWTFVLHTFLSGAFGYFLARSFRLRPSSAVVCGASFMLTGYMTSHLFGGHDGRMFAMALIPLALGLLNRGLETGEARWYCGLAATIAAQVFTPHTQMMYFSSLALALFFAFHLLFRIPRASGSGWWKGYVPPVAAFALTVVASIALAGPQLFPVLALLSDVTRAAAETGYEFAASWALPPQELTAFFLPDLVSSLPGSYWGQNPIKLHTEYLGSVPIALAILGVAAAWGRGVTAEQRRIVGFLAVGSLLGVLFALGAATPVHRIAYAILPLIGSLRAPAMMLGPVAVFVGLLAAYGWEAVLRARDEEPRVSRVFLAVLAGPILLLGVWAAVSPSGLANFALLSWYPDGWPRRLQPGLVPLLRSNGLVLLAGFGLAWGVSWAVAHRRLAVWALVPVLAFGILDLWRVNARYLNVQATEAALATDPVIAAIREQAGPGDRVWAPQLAGPVRNYRPNELAYHGISSATGLQKFLLDSYAALVGGIVPDQGLARDPVRRLLNVRYLIMPGAQDGVESLAEASGRHLYEIPAAGYAFFPAEIELVSSPSEAAARTRDNPDPAGLSVVESTGDADPPEAGRGVAVVTRYEPDLVGLDVEAERAGLLAVSEIHGPGWRAFVDGEEAAIWRVNTAFRGVEVPEGRHRLSFEYRDPSLRLGVWASLIVLLLIVSILVRSRFIARTPQGDA